MKQGVYYLTVPVGQKSGQGLSQGIGWGTFPSGAQGPLPTSYGCWPNSAPCNCKTVVPAFMLARGCQLEVALGN